jgi:serine/threonine protein kinase
MRHHILAKTTRGSASMPDVPVQPSAIGMYHIERMIGYGGMGTVYLGRHTLLDRTAAIKVLLPALSRNEEVVRRFFNEARALSRISDPGIVQIFDFGYLDDGRAFIVMELLEGESMYARLKRIRRFEATDCLRLSRLICGSLASVHAQGIVHRDLKPGNIFLVGDTSTSSGERVKIFDFGIAKQTGNAVGIQTRAGMLMGTPMYMSPEQCRGSADIDHRSDIYSIACVMFTMVTGRPPFGRRSPRDLVMTHLREPPPLASSIAPEVPAIVDDILQRCLKKSPEDRFQSMMELGHAISVAEQTLTTATTRPAPVLSASAVTRSLMRSSFDPQIAISAPAASTPAHERDPPRGDGVAVTARNESGPGGMSAPTAPVLHADSVRPIAPIVRRGSVRRRWTAGVIFVTASVLGMLCAIVIQSTEGRDDAMLREPPAARAEARSKPVEHEQPAAAAPATPPPPTSASPTGSAGLPTVNGSGAVVPSPPRTSPTTAGPHPGRPRENGKHLPRRDTKGEHANATQPIIPPSIDVQGSDSQNVTRGD